MNSYQTNLLVAIVIFSLINIFIGLVARHKSHITVRSYIAYPNRTSFAMLTTSLMGTIIGGGMFFTVAQLGYEAGFAGIFLGISYFLGFCGLSIMSTSIRDQMKKYGVLTIFEYCEERLGKTRSVLKLVGLFRLCTVVLYVLFLAAQIVIISSFIQRIYSSSSYLALTSGCILIFIVNSVSYTFLGGLQKDILTDFWQMLLVAIGIFLLAALIGTDFLAVTTLPKTYFYGTNKGIVLLIGIVFFTGPSLLVRPDMWQRIISAKDNKTAKKSFFLAGILSFFCFTFFTLIGMYAKSVNWSSGDIFLFQITENDVGVIPAMVLISLFGAIMSSADTFLNVCSYTVSSLVSSMEGRSTLPTLTKLRIWTVFIAIIALIIAFVFPDLIDLFATGFGLLFLFFPTLYCALRGITTNTSALFISLVFGLLVYLPAVFFIPKEAFLPALILLLFVYFILVNKHREHPTNRST